MIRLAARITLYFATFSYRENNAVAGHAVGSAARQPIEQGVCLLYTSDAADE